MPDPILGDTLCTKFVLDWKKYLSVLKKKKILVKIRMSRIWKMEIILVIQWIMKASNINKHNLNINNQVWRHLSSSEMWIPLEHKWEIAINFVCYQICFWYWFGSYICFISMSQMLCSSEGKGKGEGHARFSSTVTWVFTNPGIASGWV